MIRAEHFATTVSISPQRRRECDGAWLGMSGHYIHVYSCACCTVSTSYVSSCPQMVLDRQKIRGIRQQLSVTWVGGRGWQNIAWQRHTTRKRRHSPVCQQKRPPLFGAAATVSWTRASQQHAGSLLEATRRERLGSPLPTRPPVCALFARPCAHQAHSDALHLSAVVMASALEKNAAVRSIRSIIMRYLLCSASRWCSMKMSSAIGDSSNWARWLAPALASHNNLITSHATVEFCGLIKLRA
jgi:hypothetical protein